MTEREQNAFRIVIGLYGKWRSVEMKTDEQWEAFGAEIGQAWKEMGPDLPLGFRLLEAVLETFSDMYRDGKKPEMQNYFGRTDL